MRLEIKLAYYRKSDWEKLMNTVADRDATHDTWDEWYQEYTNIKNKCKDEGFVVREMTI